MKVVLRADASLAIGSGHVMRCLTLADELRSRGAEVSFVCREHTGNMCDLIDGQGYRVVRLAVAEATGTLAALPPSGRPHCAWLGAAWPDDAEATVAGIAADGPYDWLVVDHYGLDAQWESNVRRVVRRILVIDDLADRPHDCDIILDQNYHDDPEARYAGRVSSGSVRLMGPMYALLRPEFAAERRQLRERTGQVRRVLVSFGGVDATNETARAIEGLLVARCGNPAADVIVGATNPHRASLESICRSHPQLNFLVQPSGLARLMAGADLAVGAGGATSWERCCVGLPAIVVAVAANQVPVAEALAYRGGCVYLGEAVKVGAQDWAAAVAECVGHPARLQRMSTVGRELTHGDGVRRVCERMFA